MIKERLDGERTSFFDGGNCNCRLVFEPRAAHLGGDAHILRLLYFVADDVGPPASAYRPHQSETKFPHAAILRGIDSPPSEERCPLTIYSLSLPGTLVGSDCCRLDALLDSQFSNKRRLSASSLCFPLACWQFQGHNSTHANQFCALQRTPLRQRALSTSGLL